MDSLFAPKIYTPSGFVKENILEGKKALDVGCGQRKLPGAIGMDTIKDSQADVIHNAGKIPWPFDSNSFNIILLSHVLEHVDDILAVLGEVHRIGKPGAHVIIQVPYFRSPIAFTDPTHQHFFTAHSLDYFIQGTKLAGYKYTPFLFRKLGFWYGWPHPSKNPIRQLVKSFIHKYSDFYEKYLSLIFPTLCLTWELEVIKDDKIIL